MRPKHKIRDAHIPFAVPLEANHPQSRHPPSRSLVTDQSLSCATARALPLHAYTRRWR